MNSPQLHNKATNRLSAPQTKGQVIHTPVLYEFIVWAITRGKEKAFRKFIAELAEIKSGESVLDVGCGTGTMALIAKEYVGKTGRVSGIEPSLELVAYAQRKAVQRKASIEVSAGVIERLDYPSQSFDVVLCLIVMHHMPDETKVQGIKEMARVLKSGGRLVVVDSNLHLLPSFEQEGFVQVKSGKVPSVSGYDFTLWKIGAI